MRNVIQPATLMDDVLPWGLNDVLVVLKIATVLTIVFRTCPDDTMFLSESQFLVY